MSFIDRILKPGGRRGWSAVEFSADGCCAATVLPPEAPGGKPKIASVAVLEAELSEGVLRQLGKSVSVVGCDWVGLLGRKSYGIYVVEQPPVRPEEMEQSVRWAVSSMIDFPADEAYLSWMKIPTETLLPGRTLHMYTAVARRETVEVLRANFKASGLHLAAVDIHETAQRNIASLVAKPGEGVALLTIGQRGVQLTVTFQGELYLDRFMDEVVFGGASDDSSFERSFERIVLQVQRSLDFVGRTLPFIEIGRVVLAPMPGHSALLDRIGNDLPVPVERLDLGEYFDLSQVRELRDDEVGQARYLSVVGSALRFMDNVT